MPAKLARSHFRSNPVLLIICLLHVFSVFATTAYCAVVCEGGRTCDDRIPNCCSQNGRNLWCCEPNFRYYCPRGPTGLKCFEKRQGALKYCSEGEVIVCNRSWQRYEPVSPPKAPDKVTQKPYQSVRLQYPTKQVKYQQKAIETDLARRRLEESLRLEKVKAPILDRLKTQVDEFMVRHPTIFELKRTTGETIERCERVVKWVKEESGLRLAKKACLGNDYMFRQRSDFSKIRFIHYLVTFPGNKSRFLRVIFPFLACFWPSNRLPAIQGNSYPAFPIVVSPSS